MDSRRDFTSKNVFPGYFSELSEKANSGLMMTPKGSELIKNLTTVHENGGARKMWCFSIFFIFSI